MISTYGSPVNVLSTPNFFGQQFGCPHQKAANVLPTFSMTSVDPLGYTPILVVPPVPAVTQMQMSAQNFPLFNFQSLNLPDPASSLANTVNNFPPTYVNSQFVPLVQNFVNLSVPQSSAAPSLSSLSSENNTGYSGYQLICSCKVPSQKMELVDFQRKFEPSLITAVQALLNAPQTNFTVNFQVLRKKKKFCTEFEIKWFAKVSPEVFSRLKDKTERLDFQDSLVCELAKIEDGAFNKFLDGAKQLTIINMGYRSAQILGAALVNKNGDLPELLRTPAEQRFGERCREMLYKISEDEQGMALRGPCVVGLRFKQQTDILKMENFLSAVKNNIGVSRATMIASLKKNKQYKGWSVYLDMQTTEKVEAVFDLCSQFGFRKESQRFIALDNLETTQD